MHPTQLAILHLEKSLGIKFTEKEKAELEENLNDHYLLEQLKRSHPRSGK